MPKGIRAFDIADTFQEAPVPEDTCYMHGIGIYQSGRKQELFQNILEKCYAGDVRFSIKMSYARYYLGEKPELMLYDIASLEDTPVRFEICVHQTGNKTPTEVIQIQDKKHRIKEILSIPGRCILCKDLSGGKRKSDLLSIACRTGTESGDYKESV